MRRPPNTLSPREAEILEFIKQGLFAEEISARLHISSHTVRAHCNHIHEILDLEPKTTLLQGLARKAYRQKIQDGLVKYDNAK